ncbi:MAG: CoA-binding protein [Candidatus Aenigmarchaeota archaeon]|nr:CoA-binding protein [Candidatus Aenigmarchaeota archaeon]
MDNISKFFNPKTVAVVGASRNPNKIGHIILSNFIDGFRGKIFPINPNIDKILRHRCYPSIFSVREKIDLVVIAVPAPLVPEVLDECGKKKVGACIIVSGGFRESGKIDLEKRMEKIVKKYKTRVIGPNCIGIYDPYSGIDTIFNPRYKLERTEKGSISFISQSGATMSVIMDWMAMRKYKTSKLVSYGNAIDVDEADLVEYLGNDKKTSVICLYVEGVSRGKKLMNSMKKTSRKKPIVAMKAGVTEAGKGAALSHTGSLAGHSDVYHAAFKQSGVLLANDLEQMFDFARVLSTQPKPSGKRVQIITDGGGFGVISTDWLIKNGMEIAEMDEKNRERIMKLVPPHASVEGVIDLTGDATAGMYKECIDASMDDENVDIVFVVALFQPPMLTSDLVEILIEETARKKKPVIVVSAGGSYTDVLKKSLEENGVPCFSYPRGAAEAAKCLYNYSKIKYS